MNVASFLREAKDRGAWVYGAEAGAETVYADVDWTGRAVLVLGGEGKGLRPLVAETCDALVSIPLAGSIESLNVGAAATAILFEAARQRRQGDGRRQTAEVELPGLRSAVSGLRSRPAMRDCAPAASVLDTADRARILPRNLRLDLRLSLGFESGFIVLGRQGRYASPPIEVAQ